MQMTAQSRRMDGHTCPWHSATIRRDLIELAELVETIEVLEVVAVTQPIECSYDSQRLSHKQQPRRSGIVDYDDCSLVIIAFSES